NFDETGAIEAEFTDVKTPNLSAQTNPSPENPKDDLAIFLENLPSTTTVTFLIKRLADKNLAGQFRIPCSITGFTDSIYWSGETLPDEMYQQVANRHGGGKYSFQSRIGSKTGRAWEVVISDPPQMSERERTLKGEREQSEPERTKVSSQPSVQEKPVSFVDDALGVAEKYHALQRAFAPPVQQAAPAPAADPSPKENNSDNELRLELAKDAKLDPELKRILISSVFGVPLKEETEEEKPITVGGALIYAFENQDKVANLVSLLVSTVTTLVLPKTAQNTASMFSTTPANLPIQQSGLQGFKRTRNEPTPAPTAETQPEAAPIAPIVPNYIPLED
ncbi:MAG TPA: hypothetical protein VF692_00500, partial [Pyrinomonadaceae bacterium]